MPQLDGLRAFAVFGVLIQHFSSFEMPGFFGVRLFFVLSGFLITGLLLDSRNVVESGLSTYREQLKRFYTRRMLRLYPPLLVFVAVCLVVNWGRMQTDWLWHTSYLSNVYLTFIRPGQNLFPVHILWTLSIEEQFYLAWPFFILFAPRRYLAKGCIVALGAGIAWRALAWLGGFNGVGVDYSPVNGLNTLALGSLLAVLPSEPALRLRNFSRSAGPWLLLGLVALAAFRPGTPIQNIFFDAVCALVCIRFVADAASGSSGPVGRVLNSQVITYVGRISYGVYLYHQFAPPTLDFLTHGKLVHSFVLDTLTAIGLASLSWFLIEQPIRRVRDGRTAATSLFPSIEPPVRAATFRQRGEVELSGLNPNPT